MDIIMKTFYGDDGDYADIPLSKILERMTDDWIDNEITNDNISELRDACKQLQAELDRLRGCLVKIAESVRSSGDYQEAQHDEYIQVISVELDIEDAEDLVELLKEKGGE